MFRAPLCSSSGAQDLYGWLLPVVLGALVYRSLVWCGAVGLRDAAPAALLTTDLESWIYVVKSYSVPTERQMLLHILARISFDRL